ncbi:unnamed protein product [Penicillium glandicola]
MAESSPVLPSDEQLQVLEEKIGYRFKNRALARKAFQSANSSRDSDGNKILAMAGDEVHRLVIISHGCNKSKTREQISDMITKRASNACFDLRGYHLGIDQFVPKGLHQLFIAKRQMTTIMEAIIGAVYLDCNQAIPPCAGVMAALDISWSE